MNKYLSKTVIVGMIVMLFASVLSAESFMLQGPSGDKAKFTFRFFHPNFKGNDTLDSFAGLYDLSASIPVNSSLNFIASIPATFLKDGDYDGETAVGNISVGIQKKLRSKEGRNTSITLGISLPTLPESKSQTAYLMGLTSDYYELHKFAPNTLSIKGTFAHHVTTESGLMYGIEAGPTVYIPTKDSEYSDTEIYLHYGGLLGYRTKLVDLSAEVTGICGISEHYDEFSDRFIHMASFGIQYNHGCVRPGIYYSLYMKKEMSDSISGVLGIKLDVIL